MNTLSLSFLTGAVVSLFVSNVSAQNPGRIELKIRSDGPLVEASWPAQSVRGDGSTAFPLFQLQRSVDLTNWSSTGMALQGTAGGEATLKTQFASEGGAGFYRLSARFSGEVKAAAMATTGAEALGYADAFKEGLAAVGLLTPEQFAARYPTPTNYLVQLDWDVTTAEFWPEFNIDPVEYNANLLPGIDDLRRFDFRLDEGELALFKKNGFVVSERMGAPSCGEIFARLWEDDLPVYISGDPVLQAWHRSYDMMLSELEETYLFQTVRQMLDGMAAKVSEAAAQAGEGPLKASVLDADYLVTVGRSLLAGTQQNSTLGQSDRVTAALTAVQQEALVSCFDLFGEPRAVDFSQFKPRGHYTESEQLKRYFRTVKWLGRTELRVAGGPFNDSPCALPHNAAPRELGTAIVLNYLLTSGGQFNRWQQFDKMIQTFVGWTDSMTFAQLGEVLRAAGIASLFCFHNLVARENERSN